MKQNETYKKQQMGMIPIFFQKVMGCNKVDLAALLLKWQKYVHTKPTQILPHEEKLVCEIKKGGRSHKKQMHLGSINMNYLQGPN